MIRLDGQIAAPQSPLARVDPTTKLCSTLATVVSIALLPQGVGWKYGVVYAALCLLALAGRVPVGYLAVRCWAATPFIAMSAAVPFLSGLPEATHLGLSVVGKAYAAIFVLSVLAATTPVHETVGAMRRLGAPQGLALTAILMQRYFVVLLDEWRRVALARDCRSGGRVRRNRLRLWANQFGTVFVRGLARAERVSNALAMRGFRGEFTVARNARTSPWGVVVGAALPLLVLALRIV